MRQGTHFGLFLARPREEEVFLYPDAAATERSRILIVGVGALGCPAAELLAAAPGLSLTLLDHDRVERSNLQRQILFDDDALGRPKVAAAAQALARRWPDTPVAAVEARLDESNAAELVAHHDFVVDACDDPTTKLLVNRVCVAASTPFAYGGVVRTGGQTMTVIPARSACLACAFPDLAAGAAVTRDDDDSCSRMGILAPVAGVIGALQALAALETLSGRARAGLMQIYELRGARWRTVRFDRTAGCAVCDPSPTHDGSRRQEPCLT